MLVAVTILLVATATILAVTSSKPSGRPSPITVTAVQTATVVQSATVVQTLTAGMIATATATTVVTSATNTTETTAIGP